MSSSLNTLLTIEAEKEVIGINHEQLGARVGQRWRFGDQLIYIIRHHHMTNESARNDPQTAMVYLADMVCMMLGFGTGLDGLAYRFYSEVLDRMKLTEEDLRNVIFDTGQRRQKIDQLLNLL